MVIIFLTPGAINCVVQTGNIEAVVIAFALLWHASIALFCHRALNRISLMTVYFDYSYAYYQMHIRIIIKWLGFISHTKVRNDNS